MPFVPDSQQQTGGGKFVPDRQFVGPREEDSPKPPNWPTRTARAYANFVKSFGSTATSKPWEIPVAAGEAALSAATGMVAAPVNDFWNAAMEAGELPTEDVISAYQPRTELGQKAVGAFGELMSPVASGVDYATDINNADPGVRATGHIIRGVTGILPFVGAKRLPNQPQRPAPRPAPSTAELRAASDEAFARARDLGRGEIIRQDSLGQFANTAERTLGGPEYAFDPVLHPQTSRAYDILMQEATKPGIAGHSPQGLEIIRRKLLTAESNAYRAGGGDDARLASKLLDDFDEFSDNLIEGRDIIGSGAGDAKASIAARNEGRELWSRLKRAQTIETLVERAQNRASGQTARGFENTLRNEFLNLSNNERRMRQFSPEERAAIRRVARGGPAQWASRAVGGFSGRGPVSAMAASVVGGGPAGTVALLAAGEAGALAARIMRLRDVEAASELIRRGRNAAPEQASPSFSPTAGAVRASTAIPPALATEEIERQRNALYSQRPRNALAR